MGFPLEHGFVATLIAMRLCELLDTDTETATETYYASMLTYTGCTTDVSQGAEIFGGPQTTNLVPALFGSVGERIRGITRALPPPELGPLTRTTEIARRFPKVLLSVRDHQTALCEVGEMLSRRLGVPDRVSALFFYLTERWDGQSVLRRAAGEDIPLSLRIADLARDAAYQGLVGGPAHARDVIAQRAGRGHDPRVAAAYLEEDPSAFAYADRGASVWDAVLEAEPPPHLYLDGSAIDTALSGIGDFADLLSHFFSGHAAGVAMLVARSADVAGLSTEEARLARRAALVHDVGRVGIDVRVWERPGPLSVQDREAVRLHPYLTERTLSPSTFLSHIGSVAGFHHERLDGSGYHRGVPAQMLSRPARLLAVADMFHAMCEPRPHRPALAGKDAVRAITDAARAGLLDSEMVASVIEAAGFPVLDLPTPVGLTERESEVLVLVARGLQTKQIARRLGISPKTADTHIQHAYRKIGVSTRAAATLFAMEHGLVASGELPIAD